MSAIPRSDAVSYTHLTALTFSIIHMLVVENMRDFYNVRLDYSGFFKTRRLFYSVPVVHNIQFM